MAKVIRIHSRKLQLSPKEQEMLDHILQGFEDRELGSRNHATSTVREKRRVINEFLDFVGKAPWHCTEADFDSWKAWKVRNAEQRGMGRLSAGTQRKYQGAIEGFFAYMCNHQLYPRLIESQFGVRPRQIVTEDNKIAHVLENERKNKRPAFTREEIQTFFSFIDKQIRECIRFSNPAKPWPQELLIWARDRALFGLTYYCGLRIGEVCGLDIDDFKEENTIHVRGKGSRGSGPKHRTAMIVREDFVKTLDLYRNRIRPRLLRIDNPDERALFVSRLGKRVTSPGVRMNFRKILHGAGLDGRGLTPHSFRRSFATHLAEQDMSIWSIQKLLGHKFAATTQGYSQLGDAFVNKEVQQGCRQLDEYWQASRDDDDDDDDGAAK